MSHEIRTPMNAIIGMTSLLLDTELTLSQRDYVETVRNSSDSLLAIINNILDFSKIEAGKLELEMEPFDLWNCLESCLDLVAVQGARKGIELAYEVAEEVPRYVVGDMTRLRQVVVNLLSNAVKFTEQGEVTLTAQVITAAHAGGSANGRGGEPSLLPAVTIGIDVHDTGLGIPPDRLTRLFRSFSQVDTSTTRRFGGTGLGLAISKLLAELMGGTITVESSGVPGEGSTFHLVVQVYCAPAEAPAAPPADADSLRGKRALVVDDNATNRTILFHQLHRWGMAPTMCAGASEALLLLHAQPRFDLAILDGIMPEMDGYTLARTMGESLGPKMPALVLLTSLDGERPALPGLKAHHLRKPVKPALLQETLLRALGSQPDVARMVSEVQWDKMLGQRHPLRMLMAEDNVVNQKVLQGMLNRWGYRADLAGNGLEALEALRRQRYAVVLMDVQMPELDGEEATRRIRLEFAPADQPYIIAMTANAFEDQRQQYLDAGMDDYVSKPVDPARLLAALERCWSRQAAQTTP